MSSRKQGPGGRLQWARRRGVAVLAPTIQEDWSAELKNALAIRTEANLGGKCPNCDSELEVLDQDGNHVGTAYDATRPGRIYHGVMGHDDGCPATDESIKRLAKRRAR